jgi:transposase
MDIDLSALPDDVQTLQRMVRTLVADRTALSEAQAEIERLRLIVQRLQRSQFELLFGFEDLETDIARAESFRPTSSPSSTCNSPSTASSPTPTPTQNLSFGRPIQNASPPLSNAGSKR